MNEFSLPLFHNKNFVDKAVDINKQLEKSKVTNFYFALPSNCVDFTRFEQVRGFYSGAPTYDDFKPLIEYTLEKGFDFIYLLNSPRPIEIENPDFSKQLEKLDYLLNRLKSSGVNKLRVSSPQLLTYLSINYSDFILYSSTSFEFKSLKEFQNLIAMHPTVKQFVPSHDVTKNFKLLENLKKSMPNVDVELLTDEACMGGCPHRFAHSCVGFSDRPNTNKMMFMPNYFPVLCGRIGEKAPILHICKSNNIYPWEIEEYNKIGITKFKLAGRDVLSYENNYWAYLKGVEDIKNIENESIGTFVYHLSGDKLLSRCKVKDIKPYMPNITHFRKRGHLCASICKVECTYCYQCAKKIMEKLK